MTDPRETNEQSIGDEQPTTDREEQQAEETQVRAEDNNEVEAARQSDPTEGGDVS